MAAHRTRKVLHRVALAIGSDVVPVLKPGHALEEERRGPALIVIGGSPVMETGKKKVAISILYSRACVRLG